MLHCLIKKESHYQEVHESIILKSAILGNSLYNPKPTHLRTLKVQVKFQKAAQRVRVQSIHVTVRQTPPHMLRMTSALLPLRNLTVRLTIWG